MKVGFDQINVQAPLLYRRIVNALIIIVVPATLTFIGQFPDTMITPETKVFIGQGVTYMTALLKAMEFILGQDPQPDENDAVTTQPTSST